MMIYPKESNKNEPKSIRNAETAYVNELFVREDETLRYVRQQTAKRMASRKSVWSRTKPSCCKCWCGSSGARRVIEVGALAGYSGICIARALPAERSADHDRSEQPACRRGARPLRPCRAWRIRVTVHAWRRHRRLAQAGGGCALRPPCSSTPIKATISIISNGRPHNLRHRRGSRG